MTVKVKAKINVTSENPAHTNTKNKTKLSYTGRTSGCQIHKKITPWFRVGLVGKNLQKGGEGVSFKDFKNFKRRYPNNLTE